jgi:predicted transcriptional regulator
MKRKLSMCIASTKVYAQCTEHEVITDILKICTDGCTEQKIMEHTQLSHDQLRGIMAEVVDRELLHYIELRHIYITTDKGYIFLKKGE